MPLGDDPALQSEFVKGLLRLAAMGALGAGGARVGMSMFRNMNTRYPPPEPAKPLVVDMPYYTDRPVQGVPHATHEKEKPVTKSAVDTTDPNDRNPWPSFFPGRKWLNENLTPTYHSPLGEVGMKGNEIPLFAAAAVPAVGLGMYGGYKLTDKILRAADRRRAQADLEDAQKEYQQAIIARLVNSRLPTKEAAVRSQSSTPAIERIKAAMDRAYTAMKHAVDEPPGVAEKLTMGALFPGTMIGRDAAFLNLGLAGLMGSIGGLGGYNYMRSNPKAQRARDVIKAMDRANAEKLPAPLIARLVPVYKKAPENRERL